MMMMSGAKGKFDPSLIPILTSTGSSSTDKLMQIILTSKGMYWGSETFYVLPNTFVAVSRFPLVLGLDSTTVQLILNGGFGNDKNKVAMINYLANRGLVAADAVPFILGVDKGSNFFIQSMIHSGAIDPVIGLLLLSKQTGTSQSDLFQMITQMSEYSIASASHSIRTTFNFNFQFLQFQ